MCRSLVTVMAERCEQCPDCGNWYKNLNNHRVCHGRSRGAKSGTKDEKSQCRDCGNWYKNLNNHRVCRGRYSGVKAEAGEEKMQCSHCGNWYKDLNNHRVCYGRSYGAKEEKTQCRDCGNWYKDLNNHRVCRGNQDEKTQCRDCGNWYKDLNNHQVCHGRRKEVKAKSKEDKTQCPDCENWYKDLRNHKICHGKQNKSKAWTKEEKTQCRVCGNWYKDLNSHTFGRCGYHRREYTEDYIIDKERTNFGQDGDTPAGKEMFACEKLRKGIIGHSYNTPKSEISEFFKEFRLRPNVVETAAEHFISRQDDVAPLFEGYIHWERAELRTVSHNHGTKVPRPPEIDCTFPELWTQRELEDSGSRSSKVDGGHHKPRNILTSSRGRALLDQYVIDPIVCDTQPLRCGLWNARSIRNKGREVRKCISDFNFDALFVTETWLKNDGDELKIKEITPHGYKIKHIHRPSKRGGGLAILFKMGFQVEVDLQEPFSSFEIMTCNFTSQQSALKVVCIYRPPPSRGIKDLDFCQEFAELLNLLEVSRDHTVILGDFNIHYDKAKNPLTKMVMEVLDSHGYKQHVTSATHNAGHVIDWILSANNIVRDVEVTNDNLTSDHFLVKFTLRFSKASTLSDFNAKADYTNTEVSPFL